MNAFIIIVVAEKGKIIKIAISLKLINILLWALVVFFTLNTIGILAAKKRLLKQLFLIQ
jgi:cytochrome c-type biogenesis protein CcmH/NrfF